MPPNWTDSWRRQTLSSPLFEVLCTHRQLTDSEVPLSLKKVSLLFSYLGWEVCVWIQRPLCKGKEAPWWCLRIFPPCLLSHTPHSPYQLVTTPNTQLYTHRYTHTRMHICTHVLTHMHTHRHTYAHTHTHRMHAQFDKSSVVRGAWTYGKNILCLCSQENFSWNHQALSGWLWTTYILLWVSITPSQNGDNNQDGDMGTSSIGWLWKMN